VVFLVVVSAALGLTMAAPGTARAEVRGIHLHLTPYAGYPDIATHVNLEQKPLYGGRIGLMFGPRFGIEGTYGRMSAQTVQGKLPFVGDTTSSIDTDFQHMGADLIFNFAPFARISPYVLGGYSEVEFQPDDDSVSDTDWNGWEFGGGLNFALAPRWAIRVEARDVFFHFDAPPAHESPADDENHNIFYTAGLQICLGGTATVADDDADGVGNNKDDCPGTPMGAVVDPRGCPSDSDGDGVPDGIDQCPATPSGAIVDGTGCPKDSDADGVVDGIDQCENTQTGATVDAKGCPTDSDMDGVADGLDLCPSTPEGARVDKDGCPLPEKVQELLDTGSITIRNINFETSKAAMKPESEAVLHELGSIFTKWPQLQIEIGGHADSSGSEKFNQELSQKRADAVRDFLLKNYPQLDPNKYTAVGYGESKPVADNKTKEGKAQNRRVEFKVLNTEELKKEFEK
jgi:OOP family OmpA-OmpF porin